MKITSAYPIILASTSTIRRQMLEDVGISFTACAPDVDEDALRPHIADMPIPLQALELAKAKGYSLSETYPDHIIIAADQICEQDGTILCKPGNHTNAVQQLTALQARTHKQHSAVCVIKGQQCMIEHIDHAVLRMRGLSPAEIETYLNYDKPYSSCGSYRLEGYGKHLFEAIEGNDDTIKGLPLMALLQQLYSAHLLSISVNSR